MKRGVRIQGADVGSVVAQANRYIEQAERDLEDTNARAGGFPPFTSWQECSRVDVTLDAGIPTDLSVAHNLKTRDGRQVIPTDFLVTRATGDYQLWATGTWNANVATMYGLSIAGARLKLVFWRDA